VNPTVGPMRKAKNQDGDPPSSAATDIPPPFSGSEHSLDSLSWDSRRHHMRPSTCRGLTRWRRRCHCKQPCARATATKACVIIKYVNGKPLKCYRFATYILKCHRFHSSTKMPSVGRMDKLVGATPVGKVRGHEIKLDKQFILKPVT
jgi:hypothetical protein